MEDLNGRMEWNGKATGKAAQRCERINELTKRAHEAERKCSGCSKPPIARLQSLPRSHRRTSSGQYDEYVEALADWKADQRVAESFKRRDAERRQAAEARAIEAGRKPGRSARAISAA